MSTLALSRRLLWDLEEHTPEYPIALRSLTISNSQAFPLFLDCFALNARLVVGSTHSKTNLSLPDLPELTALDLIVLSDNPVAFAAASRLGYFVLFPFLSVAITAVLYFFYLDIFLRFNVINTSFYK